MLIEFLHHHLEGRKVLLLGYGKEGRSTHRLLREIMPSLRLGIADRNPDLFHRLKDKNVEIHTGEHYLEAISGYDIAFKSPGIRLDHHGEGDDSQPEFTSQTQIILKLFHRQVIGITGTKGKSTTSSLVHHILGKSGKDSVLVGNIGLPPFDQAQALRTRTVIVFELSSNQLEDIDISPATAMILNLYPEHLDRYRDLDEYYRAKLNIFRYQDSQGTAIYNADIPVLAELIQANPPAGRLLAYSSQSLETDGCFVSEDRIILKEAGNETEFPLKSSEILLKGKHNRMNILAAILACRNAGLGLEEIRKGIGSFQGLEHRLEYFGCFRGIHFYNDSIATIPEATMEAIQAIDDIDTIILGGYDRKLDYTGLVEALEASEIPNFILIGQSGKRMGQLFRERGSGGHRIFEAATLEESFDIIWRVTRPGKVCLLSPASASYDQFRNFEERGRLFKKIAGGK